MSPFDPEQTSGRKPTERTRLTATSMLSHPVALRREHCRCTAAPSLVFGCAGGLGCEGFPYRVSTATRASLRRSTHSRVRRLGVLRSAASARHSPVQQVHGAEAALCWLER